MLLLSGGRTFPFSAKENISLQDVHSLISRSCTFAHKQTIVLKLFSPHSKNHDKIQSPKISASVEKGKSLWDLINGHLPQLPEVLLIRGGLLSLFQWLLLTGCVLAWCPFQARSPSLSSQLSVECDMVIFTIAGSALIGHCLGSCPFWTY